MSVSINLGNTVKECYQIYHVIFYIIRLQYEA